MAAESVPPAPSGAAPGAKGKEAPGALSGCCAALGAAAKKGGPAKNKYAAAAGVCAGLDKEVRAGKANLAAAKVTLRAQLTGAAVPNGC